jgi:hypothetical protein
LEFFSREDAMSTKSDSLNSHELVEYVQGRSRQQHQPQPQQRTPYQAEFTSSEMSKDVAPKKELYVDFEGYRIPVQLDNPWAVARVLTQSKGKLSHKELKKSSSKNSIKISAQAKV